MRVNGKLKTAYVILFCAVMLFCFATVFQPDTAYALLPQNYTQEVGDQWWSEDSYLGLSQLKTTVDSWKNDAAYNFKYLKENPIVIAVIDSGVNLKHELFCGKYGADGAYDEGAVDSNGIGEYDVILRDKNGNAILKNTAASRRLSYSENDVTDDEVRKHGTHVAGIVALLIHALDLEEYVKIMPIKASYHNNEGKDTFMESDVKSAVNFAIENGADVINMSLSSETVTFAGLDKSDAHTKAVLVAAAGNNDGRSARYPAALPNVIGVMNYKYDSSKENAQLSQSSNYGDWYDICAPGTEIFSANGAFNADYPNTLYKELSGTSMASPIVAFGSALFALKYRALAGASHKDIDPVELADAVRSAYSKTASLNSSDKAEEYPIFDINRLAGFDVFEVEISASNAALINQRLGSIRPITLRLDLFPAVDSSMGAVEWFENGVKIGDGFEFVYTPEQSAGTKTVKAVWKYNNGNVGGELVREASIEVKVDYMLISAESIKNIELNAQADGVKTPLGNLSKGSSYTLSVSQLGYVSAQDAKKCKWFINGELVHEGAQYEFKPQSEGRYEIVIELNGFKSDSVALEVVKPKPDRELKIFTIVFCSLLAATAATVAVALIVRHRSRAKL